MSTLPNEEEARKLGQALGWTDMLFHYINITTKPVVTQQGVFAATSEYKLLECYAELMRVEGHRINTECIRFFEDGVQVLKEGRRISLQEIHNSYQPVVRYLKLKGLNLN